MVSIDCRVDFKTGKFVASKTGMVFVHSRRPKLIQPGCFEGPAAAWAHLRRPSAGVMLAHVRTVYEKDICLFRTNGKWRQNSRDTLSIMARSPFRRQA